MKYFPLHRLIVFCFYFSHVLIRFCAMMIIITFNYRLKCLKIETFNENYQCCYDRVLDFQLKLNDGFRVSK